MSNANTSLCIKPLQTQWVVKKSTSLSPDERDACMRFADQNFAAEITPVLRARVLPLFIEPNTHYIQVFAHGQLVAFAMVSLVAEDGITAKLFSPGEVTSLFSMVVIKKRWRGTGLYHLLNQERLAIIATQQCTQLVLHTQNKKVMHGMMTLISKHYPQSKRLPLEVIQYMYGNDIAKGDAITIHDMRIWGDDTPAEFNPSQGDACRLRWLLVRQE